MKDLLLNNLHTETADNKKLFFASRIHYHTFNSLFENYLW